MKNTISIIAIILFISVWINIYLVYNNQGNTASSEKIIWSKTLDSKIIDSSGDNNEDNNLTNNEESNNANNEELCHDDEYIDTRIYELREVFDYYDKFDDVNKSIDYYNMLNGSFDCDSLPVTQKIIVSYFDLKI